MKIRTIALVILFLFVTSRSLGQIKRDEIPLLIKLTVWQQMSNTSNIKLNTELLNKFLKLEYKYDSLSSLNLDEFIFLSINPTPVNPSNISLTDFPVFHTSCQEYILAISRKTKFVYKLKGFFSNDFASFYIALKESKFKNLKSRKGFVKNYQVENLDLNCLYLATMKLKKEGNRFLCLQNCSKMYYVE